MTYRIHGLPLVRFQPLFALSDTELGAQGARRMIADGQRKGELRPGDPKLAAFALLGALNWAALWFKPDGAYSAETVAEHFVPQLLQGLLRHE